MRVIIADDELHVRRRLEQKVDWKSLGVDEVTLCDDGEGILEALEERGADILLTDIRMARMDGIEAAREARKEFPRLAVILMSAYDDKEYLKSALDLQVVGYLEKPFSIAQAEEMAGKAVESVREKKEASNAVDLARKQERQKALSAMAAKLCRYQSQSGNLEQELRTLCPEFAGSESYYAVLFRQSGEEESGLLEGWEVKSVDFSVFLEEEGLPGLCTGMKHGGILCILPVEGAELGEKLRGLYTRLEAVHRHHHQAPDWMIAVGSEVQKLSLIYRSYQDAVVTMERHFYHKTPVLYFEETHTEPLAFGRDREDSFRIFLQSRNLSECLHYLERLRGQLLSHDSTLVRIVKNHYFRLALSILQNQRDVFEHAVSEYYLWELFYQMNSLEELDGFLKDLLSACFPEGKAYESGREQMASILDYIDRNLQDSTLSLGEISRKYYMSVTYLCMYFKETTGMTLKAYIIERRMKKAARLLEHTDMKVSEVASAVGFTDQSYFTKSFGKFFGKSPSRYKEESCGETRD